MNLTQEIQDRTSDGVLWLANRYWDEAGSSPATQIFAQKKIAALLLKLNGKATIKRYTEAICKQSKGLAVGDIKAAIAEVEDNQEQEAKRQNPLFKKNDGEADTSRVPGVMDKNMVERHGFSPVRVMRKDGDPKHYGFYGYTDNTNWQNNRITNFTVVPVVHIEDGKESQYVVEINNGFKRGKRVVMLEQARAMYQKDAFQAEVGGEGNYYIFGSNLNFQHVASYLMQDMNDKRCLEIKKLGWQRKGFWAYMDKLCVPGEGMQDLDEWGMAPVDKKQYIVPAFSAAYAKQRESNPERFEGEELIKYCQSPISLDEYISGMQDVFGDNGLVGVAYGVMTLFRDVIFAVNGCFPHLNGVGPKSTGKSVWASFISKMFYTDRTFFQLNSGTDAGFYTYLSQFPNALAIMNEFDRANLKIDEWYYAFKGLYDGEAKVKNSMTQRGKNDIVKVLSGIILLGQYLNTDDDNSVLSRSQVCSFKRSDFSQEEIDKLGVFKKKIDKGVNSLLSDLMETRIFFEKHFADEYRALMKAWRKNVPDDVAYNQRIMQNWCYSATTMNIVADQLGLENFDSIAFNKLCFNRGVASCKQLRDTDGLSEFWRMIEVMCSSRQLVYGWDYMIKEETTVRVKVGAKGKQDVQLGKPTQVLYLQMSTAHALYLKEYRSGTGRAGFALETISTYMSHRDYTIGLKDNMRRKHGERNGQTSFHAFRYKDLGINIDSMEAAEKEGRMMADSNDEPIPKKKDNETEEGTDKELPF